MNVAKLILSRERAIAKLEGDLCELEKEAEKARVTGNERGAKALRALWQVRFSRKSRLQEELVGLRSLPSYRDERQLELPTEPAEVAPSKKSSKKR